MVDDQSVGTKNENTAREKYERMKQVFRFLINEAEFLIDDNSLQRCVDASPKEQLKIKIDSVRKSLGIEDMSDVELLVDELYKYQGKHEARLEEERTRMDEEEEREIAEGTMSPDQAAAAQANTNDAQRRRETSNHGQGEDGSGEGEEEVDENILRLEPELLTAALKEFHKVREDRYLQE